MKAKLTLVLALIFFMGIFNFALVNQARCAHWEWQNPLPTGSSLEDVWRSPDGTDVFAVGPYGTILRYNGSAWITMDSGVTMDLHGVWGTSSSDVFAVGESGVILHYDGGSWTEQVNTTTLTLYDVWGSSGSDVYAVGISGRILHYNGTIWSVTIDSSAAQFRGVWGSGANDVYAVGSAGTIVRWNGTLWAQEGEGATDQYLYGVWGTGSTVYAVGGSGTILIKTALASWQPMTSGTIQILQNIWGSAANDVIAVGYSGTILHYNGSAWSTDASGTSDVLAGVSGTIADGNDVYAVGTGGTILQYNGNTWAPFGTVSVASATLTDIWGSSATDIFAVGYNGTILRSDGTTWSQETSNTTEILEGVWGSSGSNVFAVGWNGTVARFDGSTWTVSTQASVRLSGIWGSSGSDVFVVGNTGTIIHFDGSAWSTMDTGGITEHLYSVWGTSASDVYAVGGSGTILQYDGSTWSAMNNPAFDELYDVWGSSGNDIYAVGYGGMVLHYDGSAWRQNPALGNDLDAVWGTAADDVYVLADATLLHYEGYNWTYVYGNFTSPTNIWGSSANDVYMITSQGGIVHYGVDTFYVDIARPDDSGDGLSPGTAWKYLHTAVDQINAMPVGNYELVVATGIYSSANGEPDTEIIISHDNVRIVGLPGAILEGLLGPDTVWNYGIGIAASNVTVRDLEILDFTYEVSQGIRVIAGDNVAIQNCVVHNNDDGIVIGLMADLGAIFIQGCTIYNNSLTGIAVAGSQGFGPYIERNRIYDNPTGIDISATSNGMLPNIFNNLIFNTGTGTAMNYGIYISAFSTGAVIEPLIWHNTLNGGLVDGIYISQEMAPPNRFEIKYNIITNFGGYAIQDGGAVLSNPDIAYNNTYNNTSGPYDEGVLPVGNISADPLYMDEAGNDFHLQTGSTSIDAVPVISLDIDLDRNRRPLGFDSLTDMGCYERRWHQVNADGFGGSSSIPYSMAVSNGRLYTGVNGGLWSYDGADWTQILAPGTFGGNRVTLGSAGDDGNLYMGAGGPPFQIREYDGSAWTTIATDSFGDSNNDSLGSLIVYNGSLYASTQNIVTGTEIWRYDGTPGSWTQVNTDGFGDQYNVFAESLAVYNGQLYAGTFNHNYDTGFSGASQVWRYNSISGIWASVNTDGFGSTGNRSVNALSVYNNELYAGTSNLQQAQLWKYDSGADAWTQVILDEVTYHIQSIAVYEGKLFTGSYNAGVWSYDGSSWTQEDTDRFGDINNIYTNCFASYNGNLYAGTQNSTGVEVWGAGSFASPSEVARYSLSTTISGSGSVALDLPDGIYDENTVVTLTATPDAGWTFAGWSDDLTGNTNPATITMDASKLVTAIFIQLPPPQYGLTVAPSGSGSVTLNPPDGFYDENTVVTMTAVPAAGWEFTGWSGDLTGSTNPTTVTMDADKYIVATFTETLPTQYTLTMTTSGLGSVTLNPSGGIYDENTVVTLTAVPDTGWMFSGWSGDLTVSTNPTTITMDTAKTVTATFVEKTSPVPPTTDSPADESIIPEGSSVTLDTSDYNDPDGDSHIQSHWEVRRADTQTLLAGYPLTSTQDLVLHDITAQLDAGLKYTWRVGYEDSDGNISWSREYTFKVGTPEDEVLPAVAAGTDVGDFGMISIVHWPNDPSPEAVFNIDYDPANYRIGTYDALSGSYIEFGEGLEMEPGRSYWILAREGLVVNFNGIPVSLVHDIEVCLHYGANGWNMIAPPNDAHYLWGDVQVGRFVEGSPGLTVAPINISDPDLAVDDLIDRRIWQWESGTYVSYLPEDNFELQSYSGYWVNAKLDGVYLVFPESAQVAGLLTPGNTLLAMQGKALQWLEGLLPDTREAIADNDSPPMPMGALDDNTVEPVFNGCFVEAVSHKR